MPKYLATKQLLNKACVKEVSHQESRKRSTKQIQNKQKERNNKYKSRYQKTCKYENIREQSIKKNL